MILEIKHITGIGLAIGGLGHYIFPEFSGLFSAPIKTSIEHRELLSMISFIGGMILIYMPTDLK